MQEILGWSPQPSTSSSRPNRFGRKTMLCVWWNQEGVIYYELLKPGETVNAHLYHQLIKLHRALREKRPHYLSIKDMTSWFSSTTTHHRTRQQWSKLLEDTQLGSATPSRLLTRPGTFWLSFVFVDGSRAHWAALRFLRRRSKMAWWVVCLERWGIFLAWYTNCPKDGKNV